MENCRISVIIPVYKVEKYLDECVRSVLNQTYKNLEIILVDDGSPDACPQMCDEYAKTDDRVIVIHKKNGGLSSARNSGISIATGDYLFFLDSDDYISNDLMETLVHVSLNNNAEIVACRFTSETENLNHSAQFETYIYSSKKALKNILKEKSLTTSAWGKLYKSELFENIRYPEGKIYEDLGTVYKILDLVEKVVLVDSRKYYYRCNPESITQVAVSRKQLDYYDIISELKEYIKEKYPKFLRLVIHHEVRNSIAFLRRISISGMENKELVDFLVRKVRKNIFRYQFSCYSPFSKLYGLLISISPKLALKVFKNKN